MQQTGDQASSGNAQPPQAATDPRFSAAQPRQRTGGRRLPLKLWIGIVAALVVIGAGAGAAYWFLLRPDSGPEPVVAVGRSLELHATRPQIAEKVAFQDGDGKHRLIRPKATNRQLALVNVTVVNRTSVITPLLVDAEATQLGNRRGERINALDPFAASELLDAADAEEGMFAPLLWGQVELDRNFQVQGWMVFDVPKGLVLGTIWWNEVDDVIGDFIDYRR